MIHTYACTQCYKFLNSCFQTITIEVIVLSFIGAVLQMERFELGQGQDRDSMFAGALLQVVFLVCELQLTMAIYSIHTMMDVIAKSAERI